MTTVMITGGAGFIGCNVARCWLERGASVRLFDNLSRRGTASNVSWLRDLYGDRVEFVRGDVRDAQAVEGAIRGADLVFHMASQVAVTLSVQNPLEDFMVNALGTLHVLEAARKHAPDAPFIYASTNKVYGELEGSRVKKVGPRYVSESCPEGVGEGQRLDFHSPYGCSKGAGDQYVRDYARIYGLPTVVFRQSCIYGLRQFGHEDQGWVAHFLITASAGAPIAIYGDGCQVRDVLYIDDLLEAYHSAIDRIAVTRGQVYNIGGGPENTVSVNEVIELIRDVLGGQPGVNYGPWRPGDQRLYVSDIRKAARDFGWAPRVRPKDGIARLYAWIKENAALFDSRRLRSSGRELTAP